MTKCCRDCHFLAKIRRNYPDGEWHTFSWTPTDRTKLEIWADPDQGWVAECWKGIWSQRIDPLLDLRDSLLKDREEDCFFIEVHGGMSFQAAEELFRLRNDNRQLKTSYRYTQYGLWVAAVGVTLSAVFGILNFFLGR